MSTKTIEINGISNYQEGDLFTGTHVDSDGIKVTVTGKLRRGTGNTRLYVVPYLPFVDGINGGAWRDVYVAREIEIPTYKLGTIVRNNTGVRVKTNTGWAWINVYSNHVNSNLNLDGSSFKDEFIAANLAEVSEEVLVYVPTEEEN